MYICADTDLSMAMTTDFAGKQSDRGKREPIVASPIGTHMKPPVGKRADDAVGGPSSHNSRVLPTLSVRHL